MRLHTLIYGILVFILVLTCIHIGADTNNLIFQIGNVVLENVTRDWGIYRISSTFGATAFDMNQDGWTDLLISNHGGQPRIWLNQKGKSFREAPQMLTTPSVDHHAPELADFDNDGDQDLYFLRGAHSGTGLGPKEFFINQGAGKPFLQASMLVLEDPKGRGRTAVWFDYDQDGFLDLFTANKKRPDGPNRLYHNNGRGGFTDVTEGSGLGQSVNSEGGAVAGDIDRDGDMDLVVSNTDGRPLLYINLGNGKFREEGATRGIPAMKFAWSLGLADYNGDGALDLYISRGSDLSADGATVAGHRLNFAQHVRSPNDPTDLLTFVTEPGTVLNLEFHQNIDLEKIFVGSKGIHPSNRIFSVGPGSLSADGTPVQWHENGSVKGSFLWRDPSTGTWYFTAAAGSESYESGAVVTTTGTISNLTLIAMEEKTPPRYRNVLLRNRGKGMFQDVTDQTHTGDPSNSRSPLWVDLDNDGDLDLFVVNAGFNGPGKQPNICYVNYEGVFEEYPLEMGPIERFGRGDSGLVADFNKDGRQDLFVLNGSGVIPTSKGPYQLFLNRTPTQNRWIAFRLVGAGKDFTNRDGIGARVRVTRNDQPDRNYWGFILGGSGSYSQSSRLVHFGLASASEIDVVVFWPPGRSYPRGHSQTFHFTSAEFDKRQTISEN